MTLSEPDTVLAWIAAKGRIIYGQPNSAWIPNATTEFLHFLDYRATKQLHQIIRLCPALKWGWGRAERGKT